jgi:hypothetical protein
VNADLSIHRMAFREGDTLGLAQALVAKKRQEFELRLLRERVLKGSESMNAGLDAALARMDEESRRSVRHEADPDGVGTVIDKSA